MSTKLPTHPLFKDLTGKTFGDLVVLGYDGSRKGRTYWRVKCNCGGRGSVSATSLQSGTSSCGCHRLKRTREVKATHGKTKTPEYGIWSHMIARCENKSDRSYKDYGARGIRVCQRWRESFEAFLQDMGDRPEGTEIDRIDNARGYEPDNCRWVPRVVNARNKRSNRLLAFSGQTKCISEWAEELGMPSDIISTRLRRGWSVEKTLATPMRYCHRQTVRVAE